MMKKLKFENKQGWSKSPLFISRKNAFKYSLVDKHQAITIGWLYVFFWDIKIGGEFGE